MAVQRKILSVHDLSRWKSSPAYNDYWSFVRQLNDAATGCLDLMTVQHPVLIRVRQLLDQLSDLVDRVEPFEADSSQRFGNKAFRVWCTEMGALVDQSEGCWQETEELVPYLKDSFGNWQRIDYGTGHEMNFVIFLLGVYKLSLMRTPAGGSDAKEALSWSRQLLSLFAVSYLPLVRKIQLRYKLEPAGSHGVFSLDDFQFLPFVWGSAQLVSHPTIAPANFHDVDEAASHAGSFMFHAAVQFIHQVKKGPFFEHSNQLWNISAVESWGKINRGLLKMYADEVLDKFPIVQHLLFGQKVLCWESGDSVKHNRPEASLTTPPDAVPSPRQE